MVTLQSSSLPARTGNAPGAPSLPQSTSTAAAADSAAPPARQSDKVELSGGSKPLTTTQKQQVNDLQKRDADVHRHEEAHLAAAGGYARSGASYTYQTGPDGKQYAVGGEVQIDVGEIPSNPRATVEKEQTVQRAALAPADPSGEDRAVAAHAAQIEAKAESELAKQSSKIGRSGTSGARKLLDVTA